MAILLRAESTFACMDYKHRIKVVGLGFPVAVAERARQVVVSRNVNFKVAGQDFPPFQCYSFNFTFR